MLAPGDPQMAPPKRLTAAYPVYPHGESWAPLFRFTMRIASYVVISSMVVLLGITIFRIASPLIPMK